jgi:AraC-like DNA-binding protein
MATNSINQLSSHFRGKNVPEFIDSHYINRDYSRRHAFLLHSHTEKTELYYVASGSSRYLVGDRFYNIAVGDIVICNQGMMHGESSIFEHDNSSYSMGVSGFQLENLPRNWICGEEDTPVVHMGLLAPLVENYFHMLYVFSADKKNMQEICNCMAAAMILLVVENLESRDRRRAQRNESEKTAVTKYIRQYLDEHYQSDISIGGMASSLRISMSYASHIFKDRYGISPKQYIIERRLGTAQKLLQLTEKQVSEIGEEIGFQSTSHFITIFKKYIGVSPMQYRSTLLDMDTHEEEAVIPEEAKEEES